MAVKGYEGGNFLGPTVLTGGAVGPGVPAYDSEVFGPVLCLVTVETLEEAIRFVNSCKYGNGAGCGAFGILMRASFLRGFLLLSVGDACLLALRVFICLGCVCGCYCVCCCVCCCYQGGGLFWYCSRCERASAQCESTCPFFLFSCGARLTPTLVIG